jgi:hypothetical protein
MTYRIVSPRLGTPGAPFHPPAGVDIDALVANGFVIPDGNDAPKAAPRPSLKTKKPPRPDTGVNQ